MSKDTQKRARSPARPASLRSDDAPLQNIQLKPSPSLMYNEKIASWSTIVINGAATVAPARQSSESCPRPTKQQRKSEGSSSSSSSASTAAEKNAWHMQQPHPVFSDEEEIVLDEFDLSRFPRGKKSRGWIRIVHDVFGDYVRAPVIVARGTGSAHRGTQHDSPPTSDRRSTVGDSRKNDDGPVFCITAAVHGNEVNGVSCIHHIMNGLDCSTLRGAVVAFPCVNVLGLQKYTREYSDGKDLNRLFSGHVSWPPKSESGHDNGNGNDDCDHYEATKKTSGKNGKAGTKNGTKNAPTFPSQIFAYWFFEKVFRKTGFCYLVDLHTASFGRINSFYVRSDLNDSDVEMMTRCLSPQLTLHNCGQDGTLRSAAMNIGIKAITVEMGNPQIFQPELVAWTCHGIKRILSFFGIIVKPTTVATSGAVTKVITLGLSDSGKASSSGSAILPSVTSRESIASVRLPSPPLSISSGSSDTNSAIKRVTRGGSGGGELAVVSKHTGGINDVSLLSRFYGVAWSPLAVSSLRLIPLHITREAPTPLQGALMTTANHIPPLITDTDSPLTTAASPAHTLMSTAAIVCTHGAWIYTDIATGGGFLEVFPPVNALVVEGDVIARITDVFGRLVDEIRVPHALPNATAETATASVTPTQSPRPSLSGALTGAGAGAGAGASSPQLPPSPSPSPSGPPSPSRTPSPSPQKQIQKVVYAVIGKATNPVAAPGDRIIHLGQVLLVEPADIPPALSIPPLITPAAVTPPLSPPPTTISTTTTVSVISTDGFGGVVGTSKRPLKVVPTVGITLAAAGKENY